MGKGESSSSSSSTPGRSGEGRKSSLARARACVCVCVSVCEVGGREKRRDTERREEEKRTMLIGRSFSSRPFTGKGGGEGRTFISRHIILLYLLVFSTLSTPAGPNTRFCKKRSSPALYRKLSDDDAPFWELLKPKTTVLSRSLSLERKEKPNQTLPLLAMVHSTRFSQLETGFKFARPPG